MYLFPFVSMFKRYADSTGVLSAASYLELVLDTSGTPSVEQKAAHSCTTSLKCFIVSV